MLYPKLFSQNVFKTRTVCALVVLPESHVLSVIWAMRYYIPLLTRDGWLQLVFQQCLKIPVTNCERKLPLENVSRDLIYRPSSLENGQDVPPQTHWSAIGGNPSSPSYIQWPLLGNVAAQWRGEMCRGRGSSDEGGLGAKVGCGHTTEWPRREMWFG